MARLLADGPPYEGALGMHDFVYWIMRYFTSHYSYVKLFGRSPFRNVAVGRADHKSEVPWLRGYGTVWGENDKAVRKQIHQDVLSGRWTPLHSPCDAFQLLVKTFSQ